MYPTTGTVQRGFTLIELSIVLVIIGLIVGSVLVGRDLIRAAQVRATITQIEKYNTAANTFRGKYNGYLPGDIKDPDASTFGLAARGQFAGQGDGNGLIEGTYTNGGGQNCGVCQGSGETAAFWNDLATASLIEGAYVGLPNGGLSSSASNVSSYLPPAKLGQGNYIYVWSSASLENNGINVNYFGISSVSSLGPFGNLASNVGLTVQQAYAIDNKIDDGLPQSGRVLAFYVSSSGTVPWASTTVYNGWVFNPATPGSSTTCFDNGNINGTPQQFSVEQNGGAGVNCALSFKFQ